MRSGSSGAGHAFPGLALVVFFAGLMPAFDRHFQVDELQNTFNIHLLNFAHGGAYLNNFKPYMVPLSWLTVSLHDSASIYLTLRFVFYTLFIGNLVLMTQLQPYFRSPLGRCAVLVTSASVIQLWEYGFEIRHDVLMLTGCLVMYGATQRVVAARQKRVVDDQDRGVPVGWPVAAGFGAVLITTCSYKGIVYALPFGLLLIVAAFDRTWKSSRRACLRVCMASAFGVLVAGAGALGSVVLSGHWGAYIAGIGAFVETSGTGLLFSPATLLLDFAIKYPQLAIAAMVSLVHALITLRQGWVLSPSLVTACYFAWALVVLFANPSPYPYNVLHVAPYAVLGTLDTAHWLLQNQSRSVRVLLGVCLAATLTSACYCAPRDVYLRGQNALQISYMDAAERLTEPSDAVLDAVGLLPSRRPAGRDWILHTSYIKAYSARQRDHFSDLMRRSKPPVAITNYRWGWLGRRDIGTLIHYYRPIAPNFWVLGMQSHEAAGQFELLRSGRYLVRYSERGSPPLLDDQPAMLGVQRLQAGSHRFARAEGGLDVTWLGARAAELPSLRESDRLNQVTAEFPLRIDFRNTLELPDDRLPSGPPRKGSQTDR